MSRALLAYLLCVAASPLMAAGLELERFAAERTFLSLQGRLPDLSPEDVPGIGGETRIMPALDFGGVTWPSSFTGDDRKAISIALNISGSYEGEQGWGNITGNFDGQGLSMGLLNQCLGQGSLQPLMLRMRDGHPGKLQEIFGPERLKSLLAMLAKWEAASRTAPPSATLSPLDESAGPDGRLTGPNQASVDWAKANLFSGSSFKPEWKAELVALAESPEYVSFQIEAARVIHDKALALQARIGVGEFRAYLLFFDFVVQNGGIYDEDWTDYAAWLKKNPGASSAQRLEKLLELRLRHVRKQYVDDVRRRKRTIINGTGTVHGAARDLPKEYSYDPLWAYR